MDLTQIEERRRERLGALLRDGFGDNKAELGRALGYKDGAYVRQMLAGERAITEKLVAKVHAMHGGKFKGWFDVGQAPAASESWPLAPFVTQAQWQALPQELRAVGAAAALRAIREAQDLMGLSGKRTGTAG